MATYTYTAVERCVMCGGSEQKVLGRRLDRHQGLRPRKRVGVTSTVVRCQDCGLIFTNPQPVPASVSDHYEKEPEEYWRPDHLPSADANVGIPLDQFRRLHSSDGRQLLALDVGAGLGHEMLRLTAAGFDTWGLEPSAAFRERAIAGGVSADRLQLGTVESAVYDLHSFDLVSFGGVLEHVYDPAAVIEQALTWLAPGGLVFAEVPSARWLMARLLNAAYRLQGLDYVTNLSPMHDPFHLYEFTVEAFRRHGERAGYTVPEVTTLPCETFLPQRVEPFAQRVMELTGTGLQLQVWMRGSAR
jgi:SAM-dependent methyltransferase